MFSHFLFPYSWFGLNLRHMVMPHMYCEMQNKLSNTRGSPLGSMGHGALVVVFSKIILPVTMASTFWN